MKTQSKFKLIFITVLVSVIISCEPGGVFDSPRTQGFPPSMNKMAKLKVIMHDTGAVYDAVMINVLQARVHVEDSAGGQWYDLPTNAGFYDLLELQNGVDTVLVSATSIQSGFVSQFRLVLGSGNFLVQNGDTFALATPSQMQSGLKFNVNDSISTGNSYEMTFDFDVHHSIVLTHGGAGFLLKPVIKLDSLVEI